MFNYQFMKCLIYLMIFQIIFIEILIRMFDKPISYYTHWENYQRVIYDGLIILLAFIDVIFLKAFLQNLLTYIQTYDI